jgi:hypothetical protein
VMSYSCEELVTILNSNAEGKNEGHWLAHIDWGIIFWAAPDSSSSICILTYLVMSTERQCGKSARTSHLTIGKFTITQGCTPWWSSHRGTVDFWLVRFFLLKILSCQFCGDSAKRQSTKVAGYGSATAMVTYIHL